MITMVLWETSHCCLGLCHCCHVLRLAHSTAGLTSHHINQSITYHHWAWAITCFNLHQAQLSGTRWWIHRDAHTPHQMVRIQRKRRENTHWRRVPSKSSAIGRVGVGHGLAFRLSKSKILHTTSEWMDWIHVEHVFVPWPTAFLGLVCDDSDGGVECYKYRNKNHYQHAMWLSLCIAITMAITIVMPHGHHHTIYHHHHLSPWLSSTT